MLLLLHFNQQWLQISLVSLPHQSSVCVYEAWGSENGSIWEAPLRRLGEGSSCHQTLTELEPHRLILVVLLG